ncbi:MAG: diacylglycerol kinase family protein [Gemmatimonadota bacterium]
MFGSLSYVGYTLLLCVPPLLLMWLRREFRRILTGNFRSVWLPTALLTLYGSLIWPIALEIGAWAYGADRITGMKLFGYVFVDDVLWWLAVSSTFASFLAIATHYWDRGEDIMVLEIRGLLASFANAVRGLGAITLERNPTIHVAVASFVLLEGALFRITPLEWLFVAVAIGSVLAFELINSAIERLGSRVPSGFEEEVRLIKDGAAAAVLIASLSAAVIGAEILLTRMIAALK